jgi:Flagellin and related hook-associated proteins
MRVPTKFLFDTRQDAIVKNQANVFDLQKRISSGLQIIRPSDNPSQYSLARTIQVRISKISRDLADSSQVSGILQAKEEALSKLSDILAKAKLNAERGIDANSTEELLSLASSVDELFMAAVEIANTSINGRYLFGGTKVVPNSRFFRKPYEDREIIKQENWVAQKGVDPAQTFGNIFNIKEGKFKLEVYDDTGNTVLSKEIKYFDSDRISDLANRINSEGLGLVLASVSPDGKLQLLSSTPGFKFSVMEDSMGIFADFGGDGIPEYHGNDESFSVEIKTEMVEIGTPGKEIFGDPSKGINGILTTLKNLSDILKQKKEGNLQELLRSAVIDIEKAYEMLNSLRAKVGEKISFTQKSQDFLEFVKVQHNITKSQIEEIDMASASVDLTLRESVLQASMIVAVRAFEMTLLRFL